jgi:hypothetical protein
MMQVRVAVGAPAALIGATGGCNSDILHLFNSLMSAGRITAS